MWEVRQDSAPTRSPEGNDAIAVGCAPPPRDECGAPPWRPPLLSLLSPAPHQDAS
jgi:hypothetical protein